MIPTKSLDLLVDEVIANEIDFWVESKEREVEQIELIEIEE